MSRNNGDERCRHCLHFNNSPEYLESVYKGMTALSSAHASVRKEDGICKLNDIYLSADGWCDNFEARSSPRTHEERPGAP
ncbi:MAG: hypothetical protein P8Y75_05380 [Nitrospirota bacterium]